MTQGSSQPAAQPTNRPQTLSIDQALATAYSHWNAGQIGQAEILCQKVLQAWPGNPEALHLLGLMAHNWNNLDLAIDYLRKACLSPRSPPVYFSNLSEMCRQKGLLTEAEAAGRQAVALDNRLVAGWNNLGIVLQEAGKLDESLMCLERVVALKGDYAEAWNNLGNTLKKLGRLDRARQCYARSLELMPNYAEGHSNLSHLLKEFGDYDGAIAAAQKAIEFNPRLADAYVNAAAAETARLRHEDALRWLNALLAFAPDNALALAAKAGALSKLDMHEEAIATARRGVIVAPQNGDVQNALGQALQAFGFYDEALHVYETVTKLTCMVPEQGYLSKGSCLMEINKLDDARQCYAEAIKINPSSSLALFSATELKTYKEGDPDIARMEEMLAQNLAQSHSDRMMLAFGLGKAWMDVGDSARAFSYLDAGNKMKRAAIAYDAANVASWMESIAKAFPASIFKQRTVNSSATSDLPIFIIGMPRSGTTLLEQILAAHPDVMGAGELSAMRRGVANLRGPNGQPLGFPECVSSLKAEDYTQVGNFYLAEIEKLAKGNNRVVDKMPANFLHAGMIALSLPKARIIHCRRDPVDTCLSCYTKLFSAEQNFTYDLDELGRFYRAYTKLMDHWRRVLPPERFIEVEYENVVGNLEPEAQRMVAFCGLKWNSACLSFYKSDRPVRTASVSQVRQPVHKRSVGRWKKHAQHLGPLLAALGVSTSDNRR